MDWQLTREARAQKWIGGSLCEGERGIEENSDGRYT